MGNRYVVVPIIIYFPHCDSDHCSHTAFGINYIEASLDKLYPRYDILLNNYSVFDSHTILIIDRSRYLVLG